MKSIFQRFFTRFRKPSRAIDPRAPRTSAESQFQDQLGQMDYSDEQRVFDKKSFEKGQESLHQGFGTSTHSGDNPFREEDPKTH